ncbi:hypothetical protein [Tatumella sp. OPLPL6]|uniref:hypothetical protein n=1 Tax=Tatumella sp. OPLPL6 TaxID=1928657 RepID=UPI000C17AC3A|nr:hypothetical protein [Tatumella sp. OPLPL6]PIJ46373.1 hypothetical protein BOM24_00975 [Tatumella sp. OPLPL6]
MPITVYSKTFSRELDKEQLERLYLKNISNDLTNFREFVKEDVECPMCNVTGAFFVSDGYSKETGRKIKQGHFAFRKPNDTDAHKVFCDYYNGPDKVRDSARNVFTNFGKDGSVVTSLVRELVCRGIENNVFNQADIRDMRKWFTDLRGSGSVVINYSPHVINVLKASLQSPPDDGIDKFQEGDQYEPGFSLNDEVYKSISKKYPAFLNIDIKDRENDRLMWFSNTLARQAHRLVLKDRGLQTFDRRDLNDKYLAALKLSDEIIKNYDVLKRRLRNYSSISRSNQLLALSALLLFVSDWDKDLAVEKFTSLYNAKTSTIPDAGNVMGMNPFIHYDAWKVIHRVQDLITSLPDFSNIDEEFNLERLRLSELYGLN